MPIRNTVWTVSAQPQSLLEARLPSERMLEDMIVAAPRILSDEWMLMGRQERTGSGGVIDLLAIAPDGALVLIELKRDRTPREVVAQAIDYAVWVEGLEAQDIAAVYNRFAPGRDLAADFHARFGQPLDEDTLNDSHQIVIVATHLDEGSERIVLGLPIGLDGKDTPQTSRVREVAADLGNALQIPIDLIDERMTSQSAQREQRDISARPAADDARAAAAILQTYIEQNPL